MGMACQTTAASTGRFVGKLEADRQDKGNGELKERPAIAEQLKIGGFIMKIDSDSAVLSRRFGPVAHVFPSVIGSQTS
jgi:hypothetical protein